MRITDLHVLFDHFTVALILTGIVAEFVTITRQSENSFGWSALRIGAVSMLLSVLSGFVAEEKSFMDAATQPLSSYHKVISIIALAVIVGGILLRLSSRDGFATARAAGVRGAYFTMLVLGFILTSISVYLGMELVYEHGVNVRPYEHLIESLPPAEQPAANPAEQSGPNPAQQPPSNPAQQPNGNSVQQPNGNSVQQSNGNPAQQPAGNTAQKPITDPAKKPAATSADSVRIDTVKK